MQGIGNIVGFGQNKAFRVRAATLDDLEIISAMLQDSIVPIGEIIFQSRENRFVMIAQRFRWEADTNLASPSPHYKLNQDQTDPYFERICCAVRFETVLTVKTHGIDLSSRRQMLNFLSIHLKDNNIFLAFSDGKTIRLTIKKIACNVEDLGEPWPTFHRPAHSDD